MQLSSSFGPNSSLRSTAPGCLVSALGQVFRRALGTINCLEGKTTQRFEVPVPLALVILGVRLLRRMLSLFSSPLFVVILKVVFEVSQWLK
jgi:hypothetical protein